MSTNLDDKQIGRLKQLLTLLEPDQLTKKDFEDAFRRVLEAILKKEEQMQKAIERLEETYTLLLEKLRNDHAFSLTELKNKTNQLFVEGRLQEMDKKTQFENLKRDLNDLAGRKLKELDGKVIKLNEDDFLSKKNLDGLGKILTARIDGKMKEMDEHKSLKEDIVEELKKEMAEIKTKLADIPRGKTMGRAKSQVIRAVDLSSQVDGIVTTYTLAPDTVDVLFVYSTQFPQILRPTIDFTFSGRTLTLTSQIGVIQSGQSLTALCDVLFYP